jgi:hypothetical protein
LGLAGEENSSIFAPALRHNEGCGVEWEVHYILGYGVFFKAIKLKKIKVKKTYFFTCQNQKRVYICSRKNSEAFIGNGGCFEVLLRMESF